MAVRLTGVSPRQDVLVVVVERGKQTLLLGEILQHARGALPPERQCWRKGGGAFPE